MNALNSYDCIIGIIHHSNPYLIDRCISSIIAETQKKNLITVLDNSNDAQFMSNLQSKYPDVVVVTNKKVSGFARNMNTLIKKYSDKADYFLILNDDTIITDAAIDKMIDYLKTKKEIAAISPKLIYPNGSPQLSAGFFNMKKEIWRFSGLGRIFTPGAKSYVGKALKKLIPTKTGLMKYLKSFYETDKPWTADYISGTCMLLKSEALIDVGLLSEDYFMYAEDVDWCRRVRMKNWSVGVFPKAVVVHHQNSSMNFRAFIERERSSLIYFTKYSSSKLTLVLYRIIILLMSLVKLIFAAFTKNKYLSRKDLYRSYVNIMAIMLKNETAYSKKRN